MSERRNWYRLDNAAIIIPPSTGGASTRVFRIVCELKEEVNPEVLQEALNTTIKEFPFLNVVLRKGLFWYYLDECDEIPIVHEENQVPCAPLYYPGRRNLLYRVVYFHKRINLEMFHVLADGTGAMVFFQSLLCTYLTYQHALHVTDDIFTSSIDERNADAFRKYYQKNEFRKNLDQNIHGKAYQLKGEKDENFINHLVEIQVSASAFIKIAHSYNVTAGILAVAFYIQAIEEEMRMSDKKFPIVISVPVNLRNYFPTDTARNFYGNINISYTTNGNKETLESIIESVKKEFEEQLTLDRITDSMNSFSAIEHNFVIKLIPLFVKDIVLRMFYRKAAKGVTATVSNLGVIHMPQETVPYIERFSAFMAKSNMQICVTSFNDHMIFGCCSDFSDNEVIYRFVKLLTSAGLEVQIASSDRDVG